MFVQVIDGKLPDREGPPPRHRRLAGGRTFTQVVYFTNEDEARKGEQAEVSPADAEAVSEVTRLLEVERYVDLPEPWVFSA
jgi:hypothetical protein